MDEQIRNMEAELRQTEQPIVWGEGAAEELEARERRRAILPRLITAAKVKRAELRIQREQQAAEPWRPNAPRHTRRCSERRPGT